MKKNVMEAILYGGVLLLLLILLIFSKDIRKRLLQGDIAEDAVTTEFPDRGDAIRQNYPDTEGTAAAGEIQTETGIDPASVTTEIMNGIPETSEPAEVSNPDVTQPASEEQSEEPYDGENNL